MTSVSPNTSRVNVAGVADSSWPACDPVLNAYGQTQVDVPFPIISPFLMRSDLQKLDTTVEGLTRVDCQYPNYARQRLELMANGGCDFLLTQPASIDEERQRLWAMLYAIRTVSGATVAAISVAHIGQNWEIRFMLAGLLWRWNGVQAKLASIRSDADRLADWLVGRSAQYRSADGRALVLLGLAWALSMQEDFVLLVNRARTGSASKEVIAEALTVAFPSGWSPAEKLGQTLSQIHFPVADGQALRRASPGLSEAISEKGPFVRHVWNLTDSPHLDQHPRRARVSREAENHDWGDAAEPAKFRINEPGSLSHIWLRCERQTTLALPEQQRSLFLIRVYLVPLNHAVDSEEKRTTLVNALRSMTDAVVDYKNLGALRQQVLTEWG